MAKAPSPRFFARDFTAIMGTGQDAERVLVSADEKAKFCTDLARFIVGGFKRSDFTIKLYANVSSTFGHIAHYNAHGFFATWLDTPKRQLAFLERILDWRPYGQPEHTRVDCERAIQTWLRSTDIVPDLSIKVHAEREHTEREQLRILLAKYPDETRAQPSPERALRTVR